MSDAHEISPTARALLALEAIQNVPGITAQRLGERLGVTERAARRYVAILREAGLPIESVTGPYGGYQVGRGLRLPPLTFSAAEAAGLVMAVIEGHGAAADPADLVGGGARQDPPGAARPRVRHCPADQGRHAATGDRAAAGQPRADHRAFRGVRVRAAAAHRLPAAEPLRRGPQLGGAGDGGRPVGGDPAAQPLVPAVLVAHQGRAAGAAGGQDRLRRAADSTASPRPPTSTRCASSRSTCRRAGPSRSTCWSTPRRPRWPAGCPGRSGCWTPSGDGTRTRLLRVDRRAGLVREPPRGAAVRVPGDGVRRSYATPSRRSACGCSRPAQREP